MGKVASAVRVKRSNGSTTHLRNGAAEFADAVVYCRAGADIVASIACAAGVMKTRSLPI